MSPLIRLVLAAAALMAATVAPAAASGDGDEPTSTSVPTEVQGTTTSTTVPLETAVPVEPSMVPLECANFLIYAAVTTIPDIDGVVYSYEGEVIEPGDYSAVPGVHFFTATPAAGFEFAEGESVDYSLEVPAVGPCVGPPGPQGPPGPPGLPGSPAPATPIVTAPPFTG